MKQIKKGIHYNKLCFFLTKTFWRLEEQMYLEGVVRVGVKLYGTIISIHKSISTPEKKISLSLELKKGEKSRKEI